jgi:hypothetical protein
MSVLQFVIVVLSNLLSILMPAKVVIFFELQNLEAKLFAFR